MRTFAALALLAAAGPAAAQEQAAKPAPKEERRPLNLKLDQPARLYVREHATETPDGKAAAENLPSLGGGAATLEKPAEPRARTRTSPYPMDTETGR
jgi:hypothetical protein